jgi:hypothetical protein
VSAWCGPSMADWWRAERPAKEKPRIGAGLSVSGERRSFFGGWARRLVPITAQGIGMRDAHVAASIGAGSAMPFPWLVCRGGPLDVIGRRTRPRLIDDPTVRRAPSIRAPSTRRAVCSTGMTSTGIRLRRGIGWGLTIGWSGSAILCIRLHHPGGRDQNSHACDSDQSAFHRLPPCGLVEE